MIFDPKYKLDTETADASSNDAGEEAAGEEAEPEAAGEEAEPEAAGAGKPKKIDIDKMHAYRDSIRDVDDHRVVQYAAILYPGLTVEYGVGLAAVAARPSDSEFTDALRAVLEEQLSRAIRLPVPSLADWDADGSP